jgi:broad specificity phosphatase PhoE
LAHFLLIRHGDNDHLHRRILAGRQSGVHLNERGRKQAAELARVMTPLSIEAIYSSPMDRARETAEPLAIQLGLPIHLLPALNEIEFGTWTGIPYDQLTDDPRWRAFNSFRSSTRVPGGEIIFEVQTRMLTALEELCGLHPEGLVTVFGHGDPIRTVLAHFMGMPLDLIPRLRLNPASISAVNFASWGAEVLCINHCLETFTFLPATCFRQRDRP